MTDDFSFDMGFSDHSTPGVEPKEYEVFPEGEFQAVGIYEYVTVDPEGQPYYKDQKGRAAATLRLMQADGSEGPPMICEAWKLVQVVKALGGDVYALPKNRLTPEFLQAALVQANWRQADPIPGDKRNRVPVKGWVNKNGWVSSLDGMDIPYDQYFTVRVAEWRSLDGKELLTFQKKNDNWSGQYVVLYLEVVGDMNGKRTPFDDSRIRVEVEQPFNGVDQVQNEYGDYFVPRARVAVNSGRPVAVTRMMQILRCFWPAVREYVWESDPTRSAYSCNEAENPIVVIADMTKRSGRTAVGGMSVRTNNRTHREYYAWDVRELKPLDEVTQQVVVQKPDDGEKGGEALYRLSLRIDELTGEKAFVGDSYKLNAAGKAWCNANLTALLEEFKEQLPVKQLGRFTEEQAEFLLGILNERFAVTEDEGFG